VLAAPVGSKNDHTAFHIFLKCMKADVSEADETAVVVAPKPLNQISTAACSRLRREQDCCRAANGGRSAYSAEHSSHSPIPPSITWLHWSPRMSRWTSADG
jgi:hypothetical protein